jgi:hypothetical protein
MKKTGPASESTAGAMPAVIDDYGRSLPPRGRKSKLRPQEPGSQVFTPAYACLCGQGFESGSSDENARNSFTAAKFNGPSRACVAARLECGVWRERQG